MPAWAGSNNLAAVAPVVETAVPKFPAKPLADSSRWIDGTQPIYAQPWRWSTRLMALTGGTRIEFLTSAGEWSYVKVPTGSGWIESSSLAMSKARATGNSTTHRWTTATATVRKGASMSAAALGAIPSNQKVAYIKNVNGWSQVKANRGIGWVQNAQLTNIEYIVPRELQPLAKVMIKDIEKRYGKGLSGVGGSRSGSTGHAAGLAAGFMIKKPASTEGIKAGDRMVEYLVANHE